MDYFIRSNPILVNYVQRSRSSKRMQLQFFSILFFVSVLVVQLGTVMMINKIVNLLHGLHAI